MTPNPVVNALDLIDERQIELELARVDFFEYCKLKYPKHYKDERTYLKDICNRVQAFSEQDVKKFLIINMPPRHYKSFTAGNFVEWKLGRDQHRKTMTGSYNETLSTTFARKVRDTIAEVPSKGVLTYRDIFPWTKMKYGQASVSKWSLEGSNQDNYLATSPGGTATGFGADDIVIDDIIKNDKEAYNELVLEGHSQWFDNTMMQRLEGDYWKVYLFMTRWAKGDLAGYIIDNYGDEVEVITHKAVQGDGSMLCDDVLSKRSYEIKTRNMNEDIVEAIYNQQPIDVKGRLYNEFATWVTLPKFDIIYALTDTADKGTDYLCTIVYGVHEGIVYILGIYFSDEDMAVTETEVAALLDQLDVQVADFESNNGGSGYARNIERILKESHGNIKCIITATHQSQNKEARILSSSAWVQNNVLFMPNWSSLHKSFRKQLMAYQRKGKNAHDDAPDVLAGIYERVANFRAMQYGGIR